MEILQRGITAYRRYWQGRVLHSPQDFFLIKVEIRSKTFNYEVFLFFKSIKLILADSNKIGVDEFFTVGDYHGLGKVKTAFLTVIFGGNKTKGVCNVGTEGQCIADAAQFKNTDIIRPVIFDEHLGMVFIKGIKRRCKAVEFHTILKKSVPQQKGQKNKGFLLINVIAPLQSLQRLNFFLINVIVFYNHFIIQIYTLMAGMSTGSAISQVYSKVRAYR